MLRDLDQLIVPGLTHWNHPRFFAWFANTGSEPGILAELLIATLNVNAFTWLSSSWTSSASSEATSAFTGTWYSARSALRTRPVRRSMTACSWSANETPQIMPP